MASREGHNAFALTKLKRDWLVGLRVNEAVIVICDWLVGLRVNETQT